MIYSNISLVCQSNFVAAIVPYLYVFNMHSIKKKHNYACVQVTFNQQTKVAWSEMPAPILVLFCFLEAALKKTKKEP